MYPTSGTWTTTPTISAIGKVRSISSLKGSSNPGSADLGTSMNDGSNCNLSPSSKRSQMDGWRAQFIQLEPRQPLVTEPLKVATHICMKFSKQVLGLMTGGLLVLNTL